VTFQSIFPREGDDPFAFLRRQPVLLLLVKLDRLEEFEQGGGGETCVHLRSDSRNS
jgi:hypothetical protein